MQTNPQKIPPKYLKNLSDIHEAYDVFLFDLWGVVHNGKHAFEGALTTLSALKDLGKPVYFLSNAPRRMDAAKAQLIDRGVPRDLYLDLYTSGEETYEHLRDKKHPFYQNLGRNLFHLGPDKDKNLFNTLDYTEVDITRADFILNTGTISFDDTLDDYREILKSAAHLALPMICANPDFFVLFGEGEAICSGLIALEYEGMGGIVHYHGKPSAKTYMNLLTRFHMLGKRALMVGDSLRTDIKGANNTSIDSMWITSGIHKNPETSSHLVLFEEYTATPTYVMEKVEW